VKRLHRIVGLILLVLWVPITAHCTLENIPGLEFLQCATDAPESNNQCDEDGCAQLESATYKTSDSHNDFQPLAFIASLPFDLMEFPADEQQTAVIKTPPEISSSWQFSLRTALPPRAPSFVS